MCARSLQYRTAKGGICACISCYYSLHTFDITVSVSTKPYMHSYRMPLWMYYKAFLPRKLYFHRLLQQPCSKRGVVLHRHIFLSAEASSYKCRPDADFALVDAKHPRNLSLVIEYALVAGVDEYSIFLVWHGHSAFGFHEGMLREWCRINLVNDVITFREGFLCIASGNVFMVIQI